MVLQVSLPGEVTDKLTEKATERGTTLMGFVRAILWETAGVELKAKKEAKTPIVGDEISLFMERARHEARGGQPTD